MADKPRFLLIEPCNFCDFPIGGQLTFCLYMIKAFGDKLALVGISTDDTPIGRWIEKEFFGKKIKYFAFMKANKLNVKPFLPRRLTAYISLKKWSRKIKEIGTNYIFTQAPEILLEVSKWNNVNICYYFPGVKNPLQNSRYWWAKILSYVYQIKLYDALEKVNIILAAADRESIRILVENSNGKLKDNKIVQFPVRIDKNIFFPQDKLFCRNRLDLIKNDNIFVTVGRICKTKGWRLILESFSIIKNKYNNPLLIFVGDGEEKYLLLKSAKEMKLEQHVIVTGFVDQETVRYYLNAADLFVFGSELEGWPTAVLEAMACGIPIVTTNVSEVKNFIMDGINGYVVVEREPNLFAAAMLKALTLNNIISINEPIIEKFDITNLAYDLSKLCGWDIVD